MSQTALILARARPWPLDKATTHRISVSLPDNIVKTIQEYIPAAGAISWLLQCAAENFYNYVRTNPLATPDDIISAAVSGRAFSRSTVDDTARDTTRPPERDRAARVHKRTPAATHPKRTPRKHSAKHADSKTP